MSSICWPCQNVIKKQYQEKFQKNIRQLNINCGNMQYPVIQTWNLDCITDKFVAADLTIIKMTLLEPYCLYLIVLLWHAISHKSRELKGSFSRQSDKRKALSKVFSCKYLWKSSHRRSSIKKVFLKSS